jgi:pimeloyl-ACP methyl ester carboxylesterase
MLWAMYFRSLFVTRKPDDLDGYVKDLQATLGQPGRMQAVRGLIAPGNASWVDVAAEIRCPVLIVHGTKDPDYRDSEAEARTAQGLLTAAPSARVEMIDGAGHYPHVEMPEQTAGKLTAFLATTHA